MANVATCSCCDESVYMGCPPSGHLAWRVCRRMQEADLEHKAIISVVLVGGGCGGAGLFTSSLDLDFSLTHSNVDKMGHCPSTPNTYWSRQTALVSRCLCATTALYAKGWERMWRCTQHGECDLMPAKLYQEEEAVDYRRASSDRHMPWYVFSMGPEFSAWVEPAWARSIFSICSCWVPVSISHSISRGKTDGYQAKVSSITDISKLYSAFKSLFYSPSSILSPL